MSQDHEDKLRNARENAEAFEQLYLAALHWAVDVNPTPGHVLANLCIDRDTFGRLFRTVLLPYLSEPFVEGGGAAKLEGDELAAVIQAHIMGLAAGVIIGSGASGSMRVELEGENGKLFDPSIKTPKARLRHNDPRRRGRRLR